MGRFEYEEWSCEGRVVGAGGGAGTGTGTGAGIGIGAGVGVGAGVGGIWSAHRLTTTIHFASRIGNWGLGHLQLRFSGKRKRHSFRTSQYVSGTLLGKLSRCCASMLADAHFVGGPRADLFIRRHHTGRPNFV